MKEFDGTIGFAIPSRTRTQRNLRMSTLKRPRSSTPKRSRPNSIQVQAVDVLSHVAPIVGAFLELRDRIHFSVAHRRFAHAHVNMPEHKWNLRDCARFEEDVVARKMPALVRYKPHIRTLTLEFHTPVTGACLDALETAVLSHDSLRLRLLLVDLVTLKTVVEWTQRMRIDVRRLSVLSRVRSPEYARAVIELMRVGVTVDEMTVSHPHDATQILQYCADSSTPAVRRLIVGVGLTDPQRGGDVQAIVPSRLPAVPESVLRDMDVSIVCVPNSAVAASLAATWIDVANEVIDMSTKLNGVTSVRTNPKFSQQIFRIRVIALNASAIFTDRYMDIVRSFTDVVNSMRVHPTFGSVVVFDQKSVEHPAIVPFVRELVRTMSATADPAQGPLPCGCPARRVFMYDFGTEAQKLCARLAARHLTGIAALAPRGWSMGVCVRNEHTPPHEKWQCMCHCSHSHAYASESYSDMLEALRRIAPHLHMMWEQIRSPV